MNATEQKWHRIVTKDLGERLDALEPVVVAIDERVTDAFGVFDARLSAQRGHVDGEDQRLRQTCHERWIANSDAHVEFLRLLRRFEAMTFWERLRWLVTGTVPQ